MNAKAKEFVCSSGDILKWVFRVTGSVAFIILIWYGSKPLANEQQLAAVKVCAERAEAKADLNAKKAEEIDKKLVEVREGVIRLEEMTKYIYHQAKKEREVSENKNDF